MGMVYKWRDGARLTGVDPTAAVERLSSIPARMGIDEGGLSAEIVLEDSRDVSSPLHPAFEWDNEVAAEEYRLEQARHVLASVVVVHVNDEGAEQSETARRMFVAVRKDGESQSHLYMPVTVETANARLMQALRELASIERRFGDLPELAGVLTALVKARNMMEKRRNAA
jgi:hypothetical protein